METVLNFVFSFIIMSIIVMCFVKIVDFIGSKFFKFSVIFNRFRSFLQNARNK